MEHYKNVERTLQDTLVMAQKTSEDIKKIAEQKAEQIIKDAESTAKDSVALIYKNKYNNNLWVDIRRRFNEWKVHK